MRNLKELMKDDSGISTCSTCICSGVHFVPPCLNCICSCEQSACIALATLITNVWTFRMKDSALVVNALKDTMSNVCGK